MLVFRSLLTFVILPMQDIDCFYAQSEELRCPSLRGRPIGVTQACPTRIGMSLFDAICVESIECEAMLP